jgi:putative FmdB family regulatory protein
MPIYEYQCDECGERFEMLVLLSLSALDLKCPRCGGRRVQKSVSLCGASGAKASSASDAACAPTGG